MRRGTQAGSFGCWIAVVGLAICVALATAVSFRGGLRRLPGLAAPHGPEEADPARSQTAALAQQRRRLDAEARALRDEVGKLREERMNARKERLAVIAERYRKGGRREYDRILLRNTCRYTVAVALRYRDLDDLWVSRGWWEVPAGESLTTDAMTRNRIFYVYAENQKVGRTWEGTGVEGSLALTVSDRKFDEIEGDPNVYDDQRTVSFLRRETGADWADQTVALDCPVEQAPTPRPRAEQAPR